MSGYAALPLASSAARTVLLSSIAMVIGPTPRVGRDRAGDLPDRFEIDIAHQPVTILCGRIIDAVHADVDHHRAGLDHVGFDEVGLPHRGDEDVGTAAMGGDVAAARVEHGDRCVGVLFLLQEDRGHRLAHDVAASQDDDFGSAQRHSRCG